MFAPPAGALKAYQMVGVETTVPSANPHQLVLLLFDGACAALAGARIHMQAKETARKGEMISKAIAIIDGGLKASLDMSSGGELAAKLAMLYDYMAQRLVQANLRNDVAALDECLRLLSDLRGAWEQIGRQAASAADERQPAARTGA